MGIKDKIADINDIYINPEIRDFSERKEEELLEAAKELDWDPVKLFAGRFLQIIGLDFLLDTYHKDVTKYYGYTQGVISSIFSQARSCDSNYGGKFDNYANRIQCNNMLVTALAEALDPKSSYYVAGASQYERLKRFDETPVNLSYFKDRYSDVEIGNNSINLDGDNPLYGERIEQYLNGGTSIDGEMIDNESLLNSAKKREYDKASLEEIKIHAGSSEADQTFSKYSDAIYEELNMKRTIESDLTQKQIRDVEKFYSNFDTLYDTYAEKGLGAFEKALQEALNADDTVVSTVKGLVSASGADSYYTGYFKLKALSNLEAKFQHEYEELNQKFRDGEATKEDVKRYNELFQVMKTLQVQMQETYRDMYPLDGAKQVNCNYTISDIEREYIY